MGGDEKVVTRLGATDGDDPLLCASSSVKELEAFVDREIASLRSRGISDIVVLTCKTEHASRFADCFARKDRLCWKKTKVPVHSCRKFKGLEAEAVILIDVDPTLWEEPALPYMPAPGLLFYTGASRAKFELRIACEMDEAGCESVLEALGVEGRRKLIARLAKELNAVERDGRVSRGVSFACGWPIMSRCVDCRVRRA